MQKESRREFMKKAALGHSFSPPWGGRAQKDERLLVSVERSFHKAMISAQQEAQLSKEGSWLSIQKGKGKTYQVMVGQRNVTVILGR